MLFRRIGCALLALMLCLGGGKIVRAEDRNSYVMAGFDSTEYREWSSNQFFSRMMEQTGISFTFQQYTNAAQWKAAKDAMTAQGELPDVLFKADLSAAECMEMHNQGVLIDLKPYLADYCPHLWALLNENEEYLKAVTLPDGSIVALPYITPLPTQNYIWINEAWLNSLKLSMPTTAQELADVLTAFKTRDPNRNGQEDEIPLGFLGAFDLKFLGHAFGLIANDYNVFVQDGQVKFMPLEENYRSFVAWCRQLYADGLLDEAGFSTVDTVRQVTDANQTPKYGAIITSLAADLFRVSWSDQYAILMPLVYDGKQIYRDFVGPVLRGAFAVTSACPSPEEMLRWVDFLYTSEGSILAYAGQENLDYLVDGDGSWRLPEAVQSNLNMFIASEIIEGGGTHPGVLDMAFERRFSGNTQQTLAMMDQQEKMREYVVRPFPYYALTKEQVDQITPLQNKIGYYVDMQLARWVLGEEEISDQAFVDFERTLDELGLPAFLQFWQDVLDQL